jgi:predicted PurR-regulated permease PerM
MQPKGELTMPPPYRSDRQTDVSSPASGADIVQPSTIPFKTRAVLSSVIEESEILHASLKAGSVAQVVVAIIAIVGLLYLLKFVMVIVLVSLLFAFVLEPLVHQLSRVSVPRAAGAFIAVVLAAGLIAGVGYFLVGRVAGFVAQIPKYSARIQPILAQIEEPVTRIERSTRANGSSDVNGQEPVPVIIRDEPAFPRIIANNGAAIGRIMLGIGFIPFLTYFMLTWKEHSHAATVGLFAKEHQATAYRTIARITAMIRSFLVGNLVVGLLGAVLFTIAFALLRIPYSYFLGVLSGFFSLIPSFGALLALVPPLAGAIGTVGKIGFAAIFITVVAGHAIMMNFLYPKLIGRRVRLNPLAVVLSLLFWSWLWGAVGFILAVPLVASAKIVCDYIDSLTGVGAWLGY